MTDPRRLWTMTPNLVTVAIAFLGGMVPAVAAPGQLATLGSLELTTGEKLTVVRFGTLKEPHDLGFGSTSSGQATKLGAVKEAIREKAQWTLTLSTGAKMAAPWIFRDDGDVRRMAAAHRGRGDRSDAALAFVVRASSGDLHQVLVGSDDIRRIVVDKDPATGTPGTLPIEVDFDRTLQRYLAHAKEEAVRVHRDLLQVARDKGAEVFGTAVRPSVIKDRDRSDVGGLIAEQTIDSLKKSLSGLGYRCATREDVMAGKMLPEDWADCELRKRELTAFSADQMIQPDTTPLTSAAFDKDELYELRLGRAKRVWVSLTAEEIRANAEARAKDLENAERAYAAWRKNLAVGDDTHCGLVIEVKPPIAQIQTQGAPTWLKLTQLYPPGRASCRFVNGRYVDPR